MYEQLRNAFVEENLTLYLGAGVSIGSNLPSWDKLVLSMYFKKISEQNSNGWRPFSNYLYAIAEWMLENSEEPLEIIARKLKSLYSKQQFFLDDLYQTLYGSYLENGQPTPVVTKDFLRHNNTTLNSVAELCESLQRGVRAVITYNYDSLLEIALDDFPHQSIFRSTRLKPGLLPIFHVHGYVPLDKKTKSSKGNEIVFSEDQYHHVAENPFNWSNLVQLQSMSNSIGLMIGLSLSDRNMRRLLDAVRNSPINSENYALLKEPDINPPNNNVIEKIHKKAISYFNDFEQNGIKSEYRYEESMFFRKPGTKSERPDLHFGEKGPRYRYEIKGIIREVQQVAKEQQTDVLKQLGITPIWFQNYSEIPKFLKNIFESTQ